MEEYRKIEITQPGVDNDKPVPGFISGFDRDIIIDSLRNNMPVIGSQDLNMLPEADGEDF